MDITRDVAETDFSSTEVFFFKNFEIVPLGSYIPMETLFPLLEEALEVFSPLHCQPFKKIKTSLKGSENGSFA